MSWTEYYAKFQEAPPRLLLLEVLKLIGDNPPAARAIDVGSGPGRDSLHLLQEGWEVIAVEREPKGIEMLQKSLTPEMNQRLSIVHAAFEDLQTLPNADLIYANYSLPFCKPEAFANLWQTLLGAMNPNGYFAGQFFGPDDDWIPNGLTGHTEDEVRALLKDFEIQFWHERNEVGPTATGPSKNWHVFTAIAQRLT